jgi:D-methionine transport system ATP-binding protein
MAIIELNKVNKIFTNSKISTKALDNVSLTIDKGDIYGIIGYSGAGKSTLLRLLNGLEKPSCGTVKVLGSTVNELNSTALRDFRQKIGMIFQHFNLLWSKTVLENVELPLKLAKISKDLRLAKARNLLKLVGLEGKENNYPSQLSGGQKQRVGIARSLANDPEILLSDESTSALDPQTTDEILDLLLELNQKLKITIVIITHEMHVIRRIANKIAVMEQGKIIESGAVIDLFNNPLNPVTKRFVQQDVDPNEFQTEEFLDDLLRKNPKITIVELLFKGNTGNQAIITQVIRQFQVDVNILQGKLKQTNSGVLGTLLVGIRGKESEVQATLKFLEQLNVGVEVRNFE